MIQLTKTFHFEMAHALDGYSGACQHIHGHSYVLQVTVAGKKITAGYLPSPGFIIDFKVFKQLVIDSVIKKLDHRLVISRHYLAKHAGMELLENLFIMEAEPSAENLLIQIQEMLTPVFPAYIRLIELKLYETKDSCATLVMPDT